MTQFSKARSMFAKIAARLAMKRRGLRSPPLRERLYDAQAGDRLMSLQHSRFNTNWLKEIGISPSVIVELGSYDGGDALRFRQEFPQVRMVTVEADPVRIGLVRQHLEGAGIEVHNFAACDVDGPVDWFSADINGSVEAQGSMYRHSEAYRERFTHVNQSDTPIQVEGRRFDSFCAEAGLEHIDLLHMDIEGAELAVLRSMGPVRPTLIYLEWRENSFENHDGTDTTESLLKQLGYTLLADLGDDRLYRHAPG